MLNIMLTLRYVAVRLFFPDLWRCCSNLFISPIITHAVQYYEPPAYAIYMLQYTVLFFRFLLMPADSNNIEIHLKISAAGLKYLNCLENIIV